jgi:mycofactocin glycosyltransferase
VTNQAPVSVSVVVPVFNQEDLLPVTLPALLALEGAREIVFVDDGSTDRSPVLLAEVARSQRRVRVVTHPENRGRSAARNTGIAETEGEILLFMDSDIEPESDVLAAHSANYADPGVVGVLSRDVPRGLAHRDPFHRYVRHHSGPSVRAASGPLHFKYFIIGYTSVRRAALAEVGLFDEAIRYGEDLDFAYRLWQRWPEGLRLEPGALVHQHGITELDDRISKLREFGRNLPILLRKHPALARAAGLSIVASPALRPLLSSRLARLSRRSLNAAPWRLQPLLIRHILASAVAFGLREARHS